MAEGHKVVHTDSQEDMEKGALHEPIEGRRGSVGVVEIGGGDGAVTKDLIEELAKAGHAVASDGHGHATIQLDEAALRKVRWRCDLCLMPIICMMYLWCFIDRANIGNARLYGLERDLGMAGYDYNIVLTAFFVAYVVFEWPINILCKIVGPGRWLPFLTFMFGLCSLLTCLVQNRAGLIAVRFFLGIFESGLLPGIAYTLTRWYSKDEVVFRLSMYIATAPLAGAFGGLLAYGIVNDLTNIASLTTWRMLFFVEGLVTVSVGIGAFFLMADKPSSAKWLTHDQKILIEARSKLESIGITQQLEGVRKDTIWSGVKSANVLILGPVLLLNSMTVQGVAVFLPTIVTAQYPTDTAVIRNLRTVPPYIVGLFWVLLMSYLAWKTARRGIYCLITAPFAMLGFALFMGGQTPNAQYAGAFFVAMGSFPFGSLIFGWLAANLSPDAARASGMGLGAFFQNIGGLISAWLYLPKDAPRYYPGHGANLAGAVIQWSLCFFLIFYQKNENKKREAGKRDYRLTTRTPEQIAVLGHRHPQFRYAH